MKIGYFRHEEQNFIFNDSGYIRMITFAYDHALCVGDGQLKYYEFITRDGFINFKNIQYPPDHLSVWKIHLSVAADDVPRATEIFLLTYQKFAGKLFKVATPEVVADYSDPQIAGCQAGKIFTLYDCGEQNWPEIVREIERKFRDAGIKPNVPVVESRPITGGVYSYYRCDRGPNAEYIEAEDAIKINRGAPHNPYGFFDPFADLDLSSQPNPTQALSAAWSRQKGTRQGEAVTPSTEATRPVDGQPRQPQWHAAIKR